MRQTADAEDRLKIPVEDDDDNIYMLKNRLSRARISYGKDWPQEARPASRTEAPPATSPMGFLAGRPLRRAKVSLWGRDTV
jgi:hypothetical protein